ncbi:MAG: hypothetical protein WC028_10035 [Candidatus Obscuribacterales bacterium]
MKTNDAHTTLREELAETIAAEQKVPEKLVLACCSDNGIKAEIVPESKDGMYSIRSSSGSCIMRIGVK